MKIKYIIILVSSAWILNSCTEADITVEPVGREVVQTFYQTDEQMILALNGAYDPFQHIIWGGSTFLWGSITSDDAVGGGSTIADQKGYQVCDRFAARPVEDAEKNLLDFWTLWYRMNSRANAIIEYADPTSQLGSLAVANAYFLKGMAYFQLVRMFGAVPIVDNVPSSTDKPLRPLNDKKELDVDKSWAACEGYLTKAIGLSVNGLGLEVDRSALGYATLASAQALLGKVYMYQGKYDEAISVLGDVEAGGYHGLLSSYDEVFDPGNPHSIESIFEINMSDKGYESWNGPENNGNVIATLVGPRAFNGTPSMFPDGEHFSGWGMNQPTQKLAAAYDAMGDTERKYVTMISLDTLQYQLDTAGIENAGWQNPITGWWDNKNSVRAAYRASNTMINQNVIVLRYADVLLLLAEAYNQTGNDGLAQGYLNEVRNRAGLADVTATGDALFTAIKKERQLELALEGDRYFDLVRWGDAAAELTGEDYDVGGYSYVTGKPGVVTNGLFPIPYDEILNYGNVELKQNPGY